MTDRRAPPGSKHPGRPQSTAPEWYHPRPPSPIEERFARAAADMASALEAESWFGDPEKHHRHRVDFLLKDARLIIELDGHDYHSTKEQLSADAKRQRYLTRCGYTVVRFTGGEIYKDVNACVAEVRALYRERCQREPVKYRALYVDFKFLHRAVVHRWRNLQKQYPEYGLQCPDLMQVVLKSLDWLHERSFVTTFIFAGEDDRQEVMPLDGQVHNFEKGDVRVTSVVSELYACELTEHLESYSHLYDDVSVVADDPAYVLPLLALLDSTHGKLIRLDNDSTSYLASELVKVRWQDIDYVIADAMGVELHML